MKKIPLQNVKIVARHKETGDEHDLKDHAQGLYLFEEQGIWNQSDLDDPACEWEVWIEIEEDGDR